VGKKNIKPLVSIITVCYNSEKYIRDTMESVLNQTYENIEYIIVDGKSSDNTLDIIKEYESKFNGRMKWISESDDGIYDAMNKGINLATGDIIATINSDDVYADNKVLEDVIRVFNVEHCDACYGNVAMVNRDDLNQISRLWKTDSNKYFSQLKYGWVPAHPSFFAKKRLYDEYGNFDLDFKIAADFDLICRFIEKNNIKLSYLDKTLVKMRIEGTSNNSLKAIYQGNKEAFLSLEKNGVFPYLIFLKPLRKILYLLKAKLYKN
jgi:glycosyltransferase involved in cell wall biosynthesis